MNHPFMAAVADGLASRGVATLRYQFPYMEKRTKRPDAESVLTDTVRAAVAAAKKVAGELPLFAGGKSMGGRMTSLATAKEPLDAWFGLLQFPTARGGQARRGSGRASRRDRSAHAFSPGLSRPAGGS